MEKWIDRLAIGVMIFFIPVCLFLMKRREREESDESIKNDQIRPEGGDREC